MLALIVELERDRIRERVIEGKRAKASKGGYIGGAHTYGFTVQGDNKEAEFIGSLRQSAIANAVNRRSIARDKSGNSQFASKGMTPKKAVLRVV